MSEVIYSNNLGFSVNPMSNCFDGDGEIVVKQEKISDV